MKTIAIQNELKQVKYVSTHVIIAIKQVTSFSFLRRQEVK